jgi:hypothetical protein
MSHCTFLLVPNQVTTSFLSSPSFLGLYVAQAGLKLAILLPQPLRAGITGMCHHAQVCPFFFLNSLLRQEDLSSRSAWSVQQTLS